MPTRINNWEYIVEYWNIRVKENSAERIYVDVSITITYVEAIIASTKKYR